MVIAGAQGDATFPINKTRNIFYYCNWSSVILKGLSTA